MITITNKNLTASIKLAGAELCSLKKNSTNKEYIWEGNPNYWGKHSPILFPIVGTLKNNSYNHQNTDYQLSRHGFARDMVFDLIDKQENSAVFSLKFSAETFKVYPFQFELQITYTLLDNDISIAYQVINKGTDKMPFSIGAHPAFSLKNNFESYAIQFEEDEPLNYHLLENNLISEKTAILEKEASVVPLTYELFEKDALIFKSLSSKSLTILEDNKPLLKVQFEGFPHLGIWTVQNASFICIEPWFGYSDAVTSSGNIMEKEGIQILDTNSSFLSKYSINIL